MKVEQKAWHQESGWQSIGGVLADREAHLVFVFGPGQLLLNPDRIAEVKNFYPNAEVIYSSTRCGIINGILSEDSIVLSALHFENTRLEVFQVNLSEVKDSFDAGAHLSASLDKSELVGVILMAGSLPEINGSHLITGIHFNLSDHIPIAGGGASAPDSEESFVGLNGPGKPGDVIAIGLSGEKLLFGHGIDDAWTPIGSERFVTKSKDNVVYRLDNMTPYEFYEQYLEGLVDDIVESSVHFPLGIKIEGSDRRVIRSTIKLDKETGAATFGGDIPEGSRVRMMKTNVSKLIDSSSFSAERSMEPFKIQQPDFALMVNCKARQQILEDWSQEEVDAMIEVLGKNTPVQGMYSSGEFCPMRPGSRTRLQNQTSTITTLKEI